LGLEIVVRVSQLREKLRYGVGRSYPSDRRGATGLVGSDFLQGRLGISPRRPVALDPPERHRVVNARKTGISKASRPSETSRLVAEAFGLSDAHL